MTLIIKTKDDSKRPHLALTHNQLQGGAANGRNISLLMKSDVEMTDEIKKALETLGLSDVNKAAFYSQIRTQLQKAVKEKYGDEKDWLYVEDFNDSVVIFCNDKGLWSTGYKIVNGDVSLEELANPVTSVLSYVPATGNMLLSEDAEDKLEEGVYSLVTKALQNKDTQKHLIKMFEAKQSEVAILEQEIKKAVDAAEAVLKSQITDLETQLTKALEEVSAFKAEKQEAIAKARKEKLATVGSDEEAEALYKATESLSEEAFEVMFKALGAKAKAEKDSDLFKEKGVSGEGEPKKQEDAGLALVGELINKKKNK